MKQGSAPIRQAGAKVEPKPHAVNPGWVNQLGNHVAKNPETMSFGKGFKTSAVPTLGKGNQGPGAHRTVHRTGSQKCHD
jgi:hypothetical protein